MDGVRRTVFAVSLVVALPACSARSGQPVAETGPGRADEAVSVSLCELVRDPDGYDGKLIRVTAGVTSLGHREVLHSHDCQWLFESTAAVQLTMTHRVDGESVGFKKFRRATERELVVKAHIVGRVDAHDASCHTGTCRTNLEAESVVLAEP